jgi:hypothetical protein
LGASLVPMPTTTGVRLAAARPSIGTSILAAA